MTIAKRSMLMVISVLLSTILAVQGERVWFIGDSGTTDPNVIDGQDYNSHNIFVVNGTKLTLQSGSITAPDSGGDGEDAVRVVNADFHAISGKISGGQGVGGTGVTITTERNSEYPNGTATFEAGVEVYGGDAVRETTTQGGDAIQVLQGGSTVTINGGKFVPGTGCTIKVCGTPTSDGVALQVIMGEAIIKGGTFEGVLSNINGKIELHGCVEYDKDAGKITGVMLDGSDIDVEYSGSKPKIVYVTDVCPLNDQTHTPESSGGRVAIHVLLMSFSFILSMILHNSDITLHGCVEYDKVPGKITDALFDGS
eukprot:CAMPEP_0183722012 /NCGR_PEP_ID=MMETSP0737-20130205/14093_1 /TAXON_ID=385413 /ORGANISM="Thalassiosira miniscula, Strain CCMP1093" /LENGTH=310 /DNA_ID=CAMNT_0025952097 /DNA_START=373 /DNA_END=1306 /DNA_ORIENTATION=+